MKNMIGFTSTSLRPCSIEEVVDAAVKCHADTIEWGSDKHILTLSDAGKAKELCDANGILSDSFGSYYRVGTKDTEQWKDICEKAAVLGSRFIRTWLGTKGSAITSSKDYADLLEDTEKMCEIAAPYGISVSNECHPNTYNDTTASSLRYLNDVRAGNIRTYYQSWYREEQKDKEKLFGLSEFIQDVHVSFSELIKFQKFRKKDPDFIAKILGWLHETDFENSILIEFTKQDKAENLIADVERLRNLWNVK